MLKNTFTGAAIALFGAVCAQAQDQDAGKSEYMIACAVCHGESGMGNGPFAELMNIDVPGLTGLAKANDGVFPFLDVFQVVDGRTGVRGHGGPMPIWGNRFKRAAEDRGPYGSEMEIRGRVAALVEYIESIQE